MNWYLLTTKLAALEETWWRQPMNHLTQTVGLLYEKRVPPGTTLYTPQISIWDGSVKGNVHHGGMGVKYILTAKSCIYSCQITINFNGNVMPFWEYKPAPDGKGRHPQQVKPIPSRWKPSDAYCEVYEYKPTGGPLRFVGAKFVRQELPPSEPQPRKVPFAATPAYLVSVINYIIEKDGDDKDGGGLEMPEPDPSSHKHLPTRTPQNAPALV
jgi:hypothetical protein